MQIEVTRTKRDQLAFEFYHQRTSPQVRKKFWQTYFVWCGSLNLLGSGRNFLAGATLTQLLVEIGITSLLVLMLRQMFFLLGNAWRLRKECWTAWREHDTFSAQQHISLTERGIAVSHLINGKSLVFGWQQIQSLAETHRHFFIYTSATQAIILPKRNLPTAELQQELKQEVLTRIQEAKALQWRIEPQAWYWCKTAGNCFLVLYLLFEISVLLAANLGITELLALWRNPASYNGMQSWQFAVQAIEHKLLAQVSYWSCFALATVLLVIPHEAAHAIVGHLAGLRVFRVSIGFGRTLWQASFGTLKLKFNLIPLGGATHLAAPLGYNSRLGLWLSVCAGPGLHLVLYLLLHWIARIPVLDALLFHSALPGVATFMEALADANFYIAISNLIPLKVTTADGIAVTDGYQMLRIPFYQEKDMRDYCILGILAEASELKQSGRFAEAQAIYQTWLAHFPDDELLRASQASLQMDLGNYESAREEYRALLETPRAQKEGMFRLALLNGVARAGAFLNNHHFLAEADECSGTLINELPNAAPVLSTRGAVLLRLYETTEGLALLKKAVRRSSHKKDLAEDHCWLAIGYALEGNFGQARTHLNRAHHCGVKIHFLQQATNEVESLEQTWSPRLTGLPSASLIMAA